MVCYFFTRPAVVLLAQTGWPQGERRRQLAARSERRHDEQRRARAPKPSRRTRGGRRARRRSGASASTRRRRSTSSGPAQVGLSCCPRSSIIATLISLSTQGLNLGIDFEGGISWDVPAARTSRRRCRTRCSTTTGSAPTRRASRSADHRGNRLHQGPDRRPAGSGRHGDAGKLRRGGRRQPRRCQRRLVSSSWGSEITSKAIRALGVLPRPVACSSRSASSGEWRSPRSLAMLHDVIVSVGDLLDLPVRGDARRPSSPSSRSSATRSTTRSSCSTGYGERGPFVAAGAVVRPT